MGRLLVLVGALAIVCWSGCMGVGPQTPAQRASEAARELNVNSRFGDLAGTVTMTSPAMRKQYLNRRAEWGRMIRVVDVDLAGLTMMDGEHAVALVDFQWTRVDEGTLHNTRVRQEWSSTEGPWLLTREKRDGGEIGLFGETQGPEAAPSRPDYQFATRVIQ